VTPVPAGAALPTWNLSGPAGPFDAPLPGSAPAVRALPQAPAPHPFTEEPPHLVALGEAPASPQAPQVAVPSPAESVPSGAALGPGGANGGHHLGVATLLAGLGTVVGVRVGGAYGGVAGFFFGGAATNLYRAYAYGSLGDAESDREAVVSGTYALAAAAIGGYVAWRLSSRSGAPMKQNPSTAEKSGPRSCKFRPIGP
jgi:hypothetical protein